MPEQPHNIVLYQWPKAQGTESIYPRCVLFHRMFNLLKIQYSTENAGLPFLDKKIDLKLKNMLTELPILKVNETYYKNSEQIISLILSLFKENSAELKRASKLIRAQSFIIYQWANEVFLQTLVYARWIHKANFKRFIKNVQWGSSPREYYIESIKELEKQVTNYISKFPIGQMNEIEFMKLLDVQLITLEDIFRDQQFILPNTDQISRSDLAIFMVVQGLLSPDIIESEYIKNNYPHIIRWAREIDSKSSGKLTEKLIL